MLERAASDSSSRTKRVLIFLVAAAVTIGLAVAVDTAVARIARDSGAEAFLRAHRFLREALKAPGFYPFTLALAILVAVTHRARWRPAVFLLLTTLPSALNQPIKWVVGRRRPFRIDELGERLAPLEFQPFVGGKNLCFPSGHAALAFATAAALGMLWPRGRLAFYVLAVLVAAERVAENAHWLSDVVAAAALGVGGAHLVRWLLDSLGGARAASNSWKNITHTSRS